MQKRYKYIVDGKKVSCFITENCYYCTNNDGEGLFIVNEVKNARSQILGTCQFSVKSLTAPGAKAKIRRYIKEQEKIEKHIE
jgi:hypothetical protein